MGKLQDRVAVVTGAASGIGYGIAVAFAREGADVAVVDSAPREQAAGVLADIKACGREALFVRCDVSDEAAVGAMAQQVMDRFARVDVLVNNAGIFTQSLLADAIAPGPIQTPLLDSETEEWRSAKLAELPMGRFGTVAEVTPTAVLLASEDGAYYAGQTLGPNGGDVML
jgi:NAD(P)-dependent dehydrogenase (short-subunit alcohol dehydrogenase family)